MIGQVKHVTFDTMRTMIRPRTTHTPHHQLLCSPLSLLFLHVTAFPMHASDSNYIREVWADNLEEEMAYLRDLVEDYPYLAMVTTQTTLFVSCLVLIYLPRNKGYRVSRCCSSSYRHLSYFFRLPLPDTTLQRRPIENHTAWCHVCWWARQSTTQRLHLAVQL